MKKIIFSFCFVLFIGAQSFSCTLIPYSFCEKMENFENVFSGRIVDNYYHTATIEVLEVFKGTENREYIEVLDGVDGDCNGIPETSLTQYYGDVGDTVIFALSEPIEIAQFDWDVVGAYRKPVNFFEYPNFWNPEFVRVENNLVAPYSDLNSYNYYPSEDIYTYDEFVYFLYSGECITITECGLVNNPLEELTWLTEIIENPNACVGSINQFEYNNASYFYFTPYPSLVNCPSEQTTGFVTCTGRSVCSIGFTNLECDDALLAAAYNNSNTIWRYDNGCEDPFELDLVQNAMQSDCVDAIYAFFYQDQSYVYVDQLCEASDDSDVFYNCTSDETCNIGGFTGYDQACLDLRAEIDYLLTDENIIWNSNTEKYSWIYNMLGLFDTFHPGVCFGTFTEHEHNEYGTLVYHSDFDGLTGTLYFQDGTFFCRGTTKECFDLYNLGEPLDTIFNDCIPNENISIQLNNVTCLNDGIFTVELSANSTTNEGFDIYAVNNSPVDIINFAAGQTIVYKGNVSDAIEGIYTAYVYEIGSAVGSAKPIQIDVSDCKVVEINSLFEKYTWLNNLVNLESCATGTTISDYDYNGSFTFVRIVGANGNSSLYFQDGTFYCSDAQGFSCLDLYNLTVPINSFTCPDNTNEDITVNLNNLTCTNNGRFTIEVSATGAVNGQYGVYNSYGDDLPDFIPFEEGETIIYEGNPADETNGVYIIYVYDRDLADVGAKTIEINVAKCLTGTDNALFEKYTWLNNYIIPSNCVSGDKITEYDSGSYSFVFVEDNDGGKLYFEDGTFYCANGPGYDCVELYGFNTPTANWTCENLNEDCLVNDPLSLSWLQEITSLNPDFGILGIFYYKNEPYPSLISDIWQFQFEGNTYFQAYFSLIGPAVDLLGYMTFDCKGNVVCYDGFTTEDSDPVCQFLLDNGYGEELIWSLNSNEIFMTYPWLNTLIDSNDCSGVAINVYNYGGSFQFILVERNGVQELYFQDGTLYCTVTPNYNCLELYNLNERIDSWVCRGRSQKQDIQKKIKFDIDFKTYPNPSNGEFVAEFNNRNSDRARLNILNLEGRVFRSIEIEEDQKQMAIDLAGVAKGIYLIQLQSSSDIILHTQKMIIQ